MTSVASSKAMALVKPTSCLLPPCATDYFQNESHTTFSTICANPDFCSKFQSATKPIIIGESSLLAGGCCFERSNNCLSRNAYHHHAHLAAHITHQAEAHATPSSNPSKLATAHRTLKAQHPISGAQHLLARQSRGQQRASMAFTRHATDIVCNQDAVCSYEFSRELLFNRIQTQHCIEMRLQNKTVGLLKVKITAVHFVCSKVSKFFTKSTELRVYSSVRCAQAGSCHGNVCDQTRRNETVSELSRARKYPGYSGCQYTCGGLSCGCFLASPSCTFYKVAHVPITKDIFEVIECRDWVPNVQIELETTLFGKTEKGSLILEPYVTSTFGNFNITAVSVQKPTLSVLGKRFAVSLNKSMILPDQFTVPVECSTYEDALTNFRECVNKIICDCNTGWTKHHCHCPETSLRQIGADSDHLLPLWKYAVLAAKYSLVQLKLKPLRNSSESVNFADDEKCTVSLSSLTGCYSCIQGAAITTQCKTKDPTKVTVVCGHHSFSIECGSTSPQTRVKLSYDYAMVSQNCVVECGNEKITLPLNGTLLYHVEKHDSVFDFNHEHYEKQSFITSLSEIKIPDMGPLMDTIRAHWKLAIASATTVLILAALSYLFGPLILITAAGCSLQHH
ncbi:hypothetical protein COOONC_00719 [Cooperia oncophora]